jgi:hypothetical protein
MESLKSTIQAIGELPAFPAVLTKLIQMLADDEII